MNRVTTNDGTSIYFKDWGPKSAQPIVFHHGWPLSGDDWDAQMLFFLQKGYRVIAHDRRGHGRSSQGGDGHDMDHHAADVAAVVSHLDLRNAIHVGHSTGGGEAAHYVARHGQGRVAKLVLIGAVPPIMVKTPANPNGLPIEVFVPIADSALLSAKLLEKGILKVYTGFPHGMCTTHADVINPDLLEFCVAEAAVA